MKFNTVIIVLLISIISSSVYASQYYQATTQLNIRSGAGADNRVVGSISQGDTVVIDSIINGWGKVIIAGQRKGFVSMKYLTTDFKEYSTPTTTKNDTKDSHWVGIAVFLLILFVGFFGKSKISGNNSSPSSSERTSSNQKRNYYCENCGVKFSNPQALLHSRCPQSDYKNGNHVLYESSEKTNYVCHFCGAKFSNLSALCHSRCPQNGKGNHRPSLVS